MTRAALLLLALSACSAAPEPTPEASDCPVTMTRTECLCARDAGTPELCADAGGDHE